MFLQADAKHIPLPDSSVDLIITDPPFNIKFNGKSGTYNRKKTVETYIEDTGNLHNTVVPELFRILKPTGTMWLVMGWNNLSNWETECKKYFPNQIGHVIWKYQFGVYAKRRPVSSHYHLLIYTKSKKSWTWNQHGYDEDVWEIKRRYKRGSLKYATKLPDELVANMLYRSSNVGDVVYDPFVGSGTVPYVAGRLGRVGFGSDIQNNKIFWKGNYYDE